MCPLLSWVMDATECLFFNREKDLICCFGCGLCPSLLMSCSVYAPKEAFLDQSLMVAWKLEKVGLDLWLADKAFLAAVLTSWSTSLSPGIPRWLGHHLSVMLIFGARSSISLMSLIACCLWVKAREVGFFVAMSWTTPCLSKIIVICLVVVWRECLAKESARVKPLNSASNIPYSFYLPHWWVLKCLLFSHQEAAAVFLLSLHDPSE